MKKSSVNTFTKGLICDLDPINVPNNILTDCLNGTIITYDGNEYSLQNDKGNYPLRNCELKPNFIPVGVKEYNGILYIVSLNPITGEEEIGSYPSPKSYSDNIIDDDTNIDLIIEKQFSETNNIDYSQLESEIQTAFFPKEKSYLNVNDKFTLSDMNSNARFEKIEAYVVGNNSNLVTDDWKHEKDGDTYYVSPVEGNILLKNKILSFTDSDADTTTFVCWDSANPQNTDNKEETHSFNLMSLTGWPTSKNTSWSKFQNCDSGLALDNNLGDTDNLNRYVEVLYNNDGNYTFALSAALGAAEHDIYFSDGSKGVYCGKDTYLGLPIIDGMRLSKVEITQAGISNSNRKVGIVSNVYKASNDYSNITVEGGDFQNQVNARIYTYTLNNTNSNTRYWILTTGHTGLISNLKLTYQSIHQNTYDCLFSFTNKIYVNDEDTLLWLQEDPSPITYDVKIKVNGELRLEHRFAHDESNEYYDEDEVRYRIKSKPGQFFEWYANSKIITKHFTSLIKDININDVITAEIVPIIIYDSNRDYNIIFSQFTNILSDSVSKYVNASWSIADEYYKFYTNPINNTYTTQSIELNVSGPIETTNDIELYYEIYQNETSIIGETEANILGVGRNVIGIDYNDDFVKENIYQIVLKLKIVGEVVCEAEKRLVTSQIFNDDMFSEYDNFETIETEKWIECYKKTIEWGTFELEPITQAPLTKSLWSYSTGGEDYFNRNIQFPTFITDAEYINYNEARLNGYLYNCKMSITKSNYLTGPMWDIKEHLYLKDGLEKDMTIKLDKSETQSISVPVGEKIKVKIDATSAVVGRYDSNEFPVVEYTSVSKDINWDVTNMVLRIYDGPTQVDAFNFKTIVEDEWKSTQPGSGYEYTNDVYSSKTLTSPIMPDNKFVTVNVYNSQTGDYSGSPYAGNSYQNWSLTGSQGGSYKVCKCSNGKALILPSLASGHNFRKINADKSARYQEGYWCILEPNTSPDSFNRLVGTFDLTIGVSNMYESVNNMIVRELDVPELPEFTEIDDVSKQSVDDRAEFDNLIKICEPVKGKYVKGIVRTDKRTYLSGISESYRVNDTLLANATNVGTMHWDKARLYCYTYKSGVGSNPDGWCVLNYYYYMHNGLYYYK